MSRIQNALAAAAILAVVVAIIVLGAHVASLPPPQGSGDEPIIQCTAPPCDPPGRLVCVGGDCPGGCGTTCELPETPAP